MRLKFILLFFAIFSMSTTTTAIEKNATVLECLTNHYSLPNTRMMHKFKTNDTNNVISVKNLPAGLKFNKKRKLVEGKIKIPGTYKYTVLVNKKQATEITVTVSPDLISPTPLMGWMSWNIFQDKISETNIKEVADLLVSTGLKEAGFNYILIDDHWHAKKRNTDGTPTYNKSKFPSGFNSLVDYIHAKGLKAGIYSDAAENTCGGEFGGYKYEEIDAIQYAKWGFDFLKYDYCGAPNDVEVAKVRYKTMSDALKNTNRQFFFNICEWGVRKPWLWAAKSGGNAWRVSFDSRDIWDHGKYDNGHCGVIQSIDIIKNLEHYAGPNQFNDADMMCVGLYGNGRPSSASGAKGMTDREYQSQFSLWSMFATPLYISFDLSTMTKATKEILTNKEVIAISQDPMGQQASCIYSENGKEIYMKDLENGDVAVAFLNRNDSDTEMEITLKSLYLKGKHNVRDLVNKQDLKSERNIIKTQVASHEVRLFRLSKK